MTTKLAEANFQKKLIEDLRLDGWHVLKLQSGMGYTVLDLHISHPECGPAWVELKTVTSPKAKIGLTPLQRKAMRDLNTHGAVAICLVGIAVGRETQMYITNEKDEYVYDLLSTRPHGGKFGLHYLKHRILDRRPA